MSLKAKLRMTTGLAGLVGLAGFAITVGAAVDPGAVSAKANPAAVPAPKHRLVAQAKGSKCNPCNPCAAKKGCGGCNPCNPCTAKKGCNPCAAKKGCSPCAAANPCGPCNPCAAKKGCNPCAAKKGCNPCAAANPCGPCNPCAAANPCGPCNPCAAANPCGPCNPCNPCNPCAASDGAELSDAQAAEIYEDILTAPNSYAAGGDIGANYRGYTKYNTVPYVSPTHGGRYVNNYANGTASAYGKYEEFGKMPVGSILAKDSFIADAAGNATPGPLFLMRKMEAGFRPDFGDWEYSMIMPGGDTYGVTNGANASGVEFCGECHIAVEYQDHMFFLPKEYRKK